MTTTHRRQALAALTAVATLLASCASAGRNLPAPFPADGPRLMLFLVVDQLSQEYLVRFRPLLTGGLAYLLDHGAVFRDAHHDHANTVTGAGHATLTTGCYPRHTGIISNQWYERDTGELVYCVQGERFRRAPDNLLVPTIGEWLQQMDPAAKVLSASGKDRSAVLLGGHRAATALWYDGGDWVTTGYYHEPAWLHEFNDRNWLEQYFGTLWEPLPVPPETLAAVDVVTLDEGIYQRSFPYAFGNATLQPDGAFYAAMLSSPFSDRYLMELARTMIRAEHLGADDHPDFLGLSFHALDFVGHSYGPNSREVLDTLLRLDATLGELLDFVDQEIGLDHVVISLSADHGVVPLPEYRQARGESGERMDMLDIACFQRVGRTLRERHGDRNLVLAGLYLDNEAIDAAGLDRAVVEQEVASLLGACDSVQRVWTRSELLATPVGVPAGDDTARLRQLFANGYHAGRSADFELQYAAYYLNRMAAGTSHGSPYTYDTWVPMIVVAPGVPPRTIDERVSTVDLAPTLADIMGITPPGEIDGESRRAMLAGSGATVASPR